MKDEKEYLHSAKSFQCIENVVAATYEVKLVKNSRNEKHCHCCKRSCQFAPSEHASDWTEHVTLHQVTERRVPTATPEFTWKLRKMWRIESFLKMHDSDNHHDSCPAETSRKMKKKKKKTKRKEEKVTHG